MKHIWWFSNFFEIASRRQHGDIWCLCGGFDFYWTSMCSSVICSNKKMLLRKSPYLVWVDLYEGKGILPLFFQILALFYFNQTNISGWSLHITQSTFWCLWYISNAGFRLMSLLLKNHLVFHLLDESKTDSYFTKDSQYHSSFPVTNFVDWG